MSCLTERFKRTNRWQAQVDCPGRHLASPVRPALDGGRDHGQAQEEHELAVSLGDTVKGITGSKEADQSGYESGQARARDEQAKGGQKKEDHEKQPRKHGI
jgi:hypothetical protein